MSTPDREPPALVVFDIDGVLADVAHRLHHLERRPKDWAAFFAAAGDDPVLRNGVDLAHELAESRPVLYLTGRPEWLRRTTEDWLARHELPAGGLLMRRHGDRRPARVAKLELLREVASRQPVHVVVDDDPAVVAGLRDAGFPVLHATWATTARTTGPGASQPTLWEAQESDGRT